MEGFTGPVQLTYTDIIGRVYTLLGELSYDILPPDTIFQCLQGVMQELTVKRRLKFSAFNVQKYQFVTVADKDSYQLPISLGKPIAVEYIRSGDPSKSSYKVSIIQLADFVQEYFDQTGSGGYDHQMPYRATFYFQAESKYIKLGPSPSATFRFTVWHTVLEPFISDTESFLTAQGSDISQYYDLITQKTAMACTTPIMMKVLQIVKDPAEAAGWRETIMMLQGGMQSRILQLEQMFEQDSDTISKPNSAVIVPFGMDNPLASANELHERRNRWHY